jgi:hypothetical protein
MTSEVLITLSKERTALAALILSIGEWVAQGRKRLQRGDSMERTMGFELLRNQEAMLSDIAKTLAAEAQELAAVAARRAEEANQQQASTT